MGNSRKGYSMTLKCLTDTDQPPPKTGAASTPVEGWEYEDIAATYEYWYKIMRDKITRSRIVLTMPLAPSINSCTRNVYGKGRANTTIYNKWIKAAGWEINAQTFCRMGGKVAVTILCPRVARADIDNQIKPTLDLLVKMNVIDDDQHVEQVTARWVDARALMEVRIEATDD